MTHKSRKRGKIMYNEDNERKDFSLLKNFILRLILIIIFVLLLIWLVPWPDMSGLAPLQEQIFNNNITAMKEAAIGYYTTERLPENVGDKKTMTLQQMLDLKLLVPFVDKNGNTCSMTESYVTIEKVDSNEYNYKMKVNLKCSDKEDYIYVYLGCYSYCEGELCEKQEDPTPTAKPTSSPKPSNKPKPTTNPRPTTSPKPTPTLIPKDPTPTPTNNPKPTPTPTDNPKPTDDPKPTPTPTPTPPVVNPEYEYEYKKTTAAQYSAWSAWKEYAYKKGTVEFGKTDVKEIEDLGRRLVKVGTRNPIYTTRPTYYKYNTVSYEVCTGYTYTYFNQTLYTVTRDWYATGETSSNPPADTYNVKWVPRGVDFEQCTDCVNHPYIIYEKYQRDVKETTVPSGLTASCTSKETRNIDVYVTGIQTTMVEPAKDIYGYVYFYRVRTRKLLSNTTTKYTWSTYNNQTLISQGWTATGEYRKK